MNNTSYEEDEEEWVFVFIASLMLFTLIKMVLQLYKFRITCIMKSHHVGVQPSKLLQYRSQKCFKPESSVSTPLHSTSLSILKASQQRLLRVLKATIASYITYVICGFVVHFILDDDVNSWRDLIDTYFINEQLIWWQEFFFYPAITLGLVAVGPAIINVRPQISIKQLLSIVLLALAIWIPFDEDIDLSDLFINSSEINSYINSITAALVIMLITLSRSIRALFIPLTMFGVTIIISSELFSETNIANIEKIIASGWGWIWPEIYPEYHEKYFIFISLICIFIFFWLFVQLLSGCAWLYERGFVSELSLLAFCTLLFFSIVTISGSESEIATTPVLIGILLMWMGLTTSVYALTLHLLSEPSSTQRTLLVLRVFSENRSTQSVLDNVQNRWRYAGPVLQIGGPDLAVINIDPYEMFKFLTFRTNELFVPDQISRSDLHKYLDLFPDREGRYRINEVFCFESTWRSTVKTLIDSSDVILLDLRGFNFKRAGTAYEMKLLAQDDRLNRVIAIGDKTTDWNYVDDLFKFANQAGFCEIRLDIDNASFENLCFESLAKIAETKKLEPMQFSTSYT